MVDYGDFECPYCGEAYPVLNTVQQVMGDKLCFVFRHFPLREAHPHAERAAEFAEAGATIGKFWEMHEFFTRTHRRGRTLDWSSTGKDWACLKSSWNRHLPMGLRLVCAANL